MEFDFRELRIGMERGTMCKELTAIVHLSSDRQFETTMTMLRAARAFGKISDPSFRRNLKNRNRRIDQCLLLILIRLCCFFVFILSGLLGSVGSLLGFIQKALNVRGNMRINTTGIHD